MVANSDSNSSSSRFPDSGASFHVTNNSQNIQQTCPFEGPDQIIIGNGQGLNISAPGNSNFVSPFSPNGQLILKNMLLVPQITKNLISVSKFAKDNHVFFEFHANRCFVKYQDSKRILLQGDVGSDGLYQFPNLQFCSAVSSPACINTVSSVDCNNTVPNSVYIWQLSPGQSNSQALKLVLNRCNFKIPVKDELPFCSACCMARFIDFLISFLKLYTILLWN